MERGGCGGGEVGLRTYWMEQPAVELCVEREESANVREESVMDVLM